MRLGPGYWVWYDGGELDGAEGGTRAACLCACKHSSMNHLPQTQLGVASPRPNGGGVPATAGRRCLLLFNCYTSNGMRRLHSKYPLVESFRCISDYVWRICASALRSTADGRSASATLRRVLASSGMI